MHIRTFGWLSDLQAAKPLGHFSPPPPPPPYAGPFRPVASPEPYNPVHTCSSRYSLGFRVKGLGLRVFGFKVWGPLCRGLGFPSEKGCLQFYS